MVKIRLTRLGNKDNPFYRIIVADRESPRDGKFIEIVGYYDVQKEPPIINIKMDRVQYWLDKGAQPTKTVKDLIKKFSKQEAIAK